VICTQRNACFPKKLNEPEQEHFSIPRLSSFMSNSASWRCKPGSAQDCLFRTSREYTAGVGFHLSPSLHSVHLESAGPLILLFPVELSVCLSTISTLVQPLFPPPKNIQETIWATGAHPAEKKSQLTCFDSTVCTIRLVFASFTGGTDDATAAARVCGSDSLHSDGVPEPFLTYTWRCRRSSLVVTQPIITSSKQIQL
jgi:hypothetical protein